ncbi:hypothetical protein IPN35_05340 [Candidatus Peregrinibacteria bacterium]|nr:MAG: hypothetical protein IPN35_05340 [Candidatus Peregrinibacteria bacterium]
MKNEILLVGSLAFDVLFSIPHDFRKSIPFENGEIRSFNATYVASEKQEHYGGCSGNIAWWLGKSGFSSTIFSAFGKDFSEKGYRKRLESLDIRIVGYEGAFTAHAYQVSDPLHQQLIIWQPNAYEQNASQNLIDFLTPEEIASFRFAVFSAGTPLSLRKHIEEFRRYNSVATVLFDPGQVTPLFSQEDFVFCAEKSDILVGNNVEFRLFHSLGIPEKITTIETFGAEGALLIEKKKETRFRAELVKNVVETTGAGDAFRAGLTRGLSQGKNFSDAILLGVKWGAECVQIPSAQEE